MHQRVSKRPIHQSRSMPQQILHGHRASRRLKGQVRLAASWIHLLHPDLHILELRQILRDRRHHVDLALFGQHHHGDARHRLRHRENAKDAVHLHGDLFLAILITNRLAVDNLSIARNHKHRARDRALIYFGLEKLRNAVEPVGSEAGFLRTAEFRLLLRYN